MNVDGIGRYYVYGGREIIVEPYANASFEKIKVFILGTAFGALLLQRGIFPLHVITSYSIHYTKLYESFYTG